MSLPSDQGWSVPFDHPFYPPLPAHYRQVRFQYVFFSADPAGVACLLPAPLEPSSDGQCVAIGLEVPFCTSYGSFREAVVEQKCLFRGREGWYCSHVWHDGPAGIAAGREIYGTPKIYAALEVGFADRTMFTRAAMGQVPVIALSSTMEEPVAPEAMPALAPSWRLKLIPRADRPGPALKQLIDCAPAVENFQAHACFRGRGVVKLEASPLCDVTCLQPVAFGEAFYLEASFSETFARIEHDYLAGEP
ncbi:MAG: acetoacetate decarboxylase family protein [Candidatus Latescibacteria bacterium]|nr:acetoacetate decarboxylase family protein [Candidatus Latescibacterota bacterium]